MKSKVIESFKHPPLPLKELKNQFPLGRSKNSFHIESSIISYSFLKYFDLN